MVNFVSFPPVSNANEDGLLAMGGDLSLDTLVSAYAQGIFPWFNADQPILWWSPDPRMVLYPQKIKISKSLRKVIKNGQFDLSCNRSFEQVIRGCALRGMPSLATPTSETWITESMHSAYLALHLQGYAHSIEVWQHGELVGGLYGVALGKVFFGESMFSLRANASKVALVALCHWLQRKQFELIDCQVASDHLFSMGATEISRDDFLHSLTAIDIHSAHPQFASGFEQVVTENAIKTV